MDASEISREPSGDRVGSESSHAETRLRDKIKSRKYLVSQQIILLAAALPILYARLGISESVTLTVLGVLTGVGGLYGIANSLSKKWGGE